MSAWNGLNNADQVYPLLSNVLTKFAKNQLADDQEWMDEVLKLTKEIDTEVVE